MPRQFNGGLDQLSWVAKPPVEILQPTPITLTGWANNWANNSVNDRFIINKSDANHLHGYFSIFLTAGGGPDSRVMFFWHNPWRVTPARWAFNCPKDNNWHFWHIRYGMRDTTEIPRVGFDLIPAFYQSGFSNQPSGAFDSEDLIAADSTLNPAPYSVDIGNTANSGMSSWSGAFWRFSWWHDLLTDKELRDLYLGRRPETVRPRKLQFHAELDGERVERDNGWYQIGQATISGTAKSLDAPTVRKEPRALERGFRRILMEKGSSPTGNVTIAGQSLVIGIGTVVAAIKTSALTGLPLSLIQGSVKESVIEPLTGQTMASAQGDAGPVSAPKIVTIAGQQATSAAGSVTPEDAIPIPGLPAASSQGNIIAGFQSTIVLPGQSMGIATSPLVGGQAVPIASLQLQSIQGQLYVDSQTEFVQQTWTKVEGPP